MVGLISPRSTAGQQRVYTGIQIQTSAQGVAVPVYYGTSRQTVNLIWYKNFRAVQTGSGGKGGLAGSAGKGTGNQYAYYADVILGVCEGPVEDFGQAWSSKAPTTVSAIGLTAFLGAYPQAIWGYVSTFYPSDGRPYTGLAYLAGASYQLGSAAELPQHTFEVYGFFSQRTVYTSTNIPGSGPYTVTVGRRSWANGSTQSMWVANVAIAGFTQVGGAPGAGQYSVSAGVYTFNAANAGAAITIQWTGKGQDADPSLVAEDILTAANYGIGYPSAQVGELLVATHTAAIPGGAHQITVTHSADFDDNLSVWDSANDQLFTCVAGTPGALEYSYATGTYTFNAADVGKSVDIAYSYNDGLDTYQDYCLAAGVFISPAYRTQAPGGEAIATIAKFTNAEVVISAGYIKFVPRGDTALSGNGHTYTPAIVVADLTDDDFQANEGSAGAFNREDPVILSRKRVADQKNVAQVECLDRTNQYNAAVVEATDQAMVDLFGRRTTGSLGGQLFCDTTIAKQAAQLILQREGVRNTYAFTLAETYIYLDPMDLVTLTDTRLGLTSADTQRITAIEEQEDGTIHVTVDEYATGAGNADAYEFSQGTGYAPNYNIDPGDINEPVVVEPAVELATNTGLELWAAISGADANWGGADIYVSSDGVTYNFVGRKWGPSRQGVLTGAFSPAKGIGGTSSISNPVGRRYSILGDNASLGRLISAGVGTGSAQFPNIVRRPARIMTDGGVGAVFVGSDPDTVDSLSVDLTMSFGALVSGTVADADDGNTLCVVDQEMIAFSNATLTSPYNYTLDTYIRRGMFKTTIAPHAVGAPFARLDETIFIIPFDKSQIANTIYIKAASFNIYGGGLQDLSVVTAYTYTFGGPPTPAVVQNFTAAQSGLAIYLSWTDLNDLSVKGYDILYGPQGGTISGATLLTTASRTTETTTVAVGAGAWTFYIRARNIADQTGPVSTVMMTISPLSQVFSVSGTWAKPSGTNSTSLALVEVWGGGGSGAARGAGTGGGGGGGYVSAFFLVSQLGAFETVTIGAGGAPVVATTFGNTGGRSSFGSWLTGFAGSGGSHPIALLGGGGGGALQDGQTNGTGGSPLGGGIGGGGTPGGDSTDGGGGGGNIQVGGASTRGGAGGGGGAFAGGTSIFGGGGGGGTDGVTGAAGGVSSVGGNGGAGGAVTGSAGVQPGGGGGAGGVTSGAGAKGQVRVTVIP